MKKANPLKAQLKKVVLGIKPELELGDYRTIAQKAGCAYESVKKTFSPTNPYCHVEAANEAVKLLKRRERIAEKLINQ